MKRRGRRAALGLLVVSSFACGFVPVARGSESGFYLGAADLAHARTKLTRGSLTEAGLNGSASAKGGSDTGFKLYAGYQFSPYAAVEAGYAVIGNFSFSASVPTAGTVNISTMEPKAWFLDGVGSLPLSYGFSLFARAGLVRSRTEVDVEAIGTATAPCSSLQDSAIGYHAGVGIGYDFTRHLGVRIEWERYRVADGIGDKADVDLFSWGIRGRF